MQIGREDSDDEENEEHHQPSQNERQLSSRHDDRVSVWDHIASFPRSLSLSLFRIIMEHRMM